MIDDGDNDGNTGGGFNWVVLITPPITKGAGFKPPLVGIPCRVVPSHRRKPHPGWGDLGPARANTGNLLHPAKPRVRAAGGFGKCILKG